MTTPPIAIAAAQMYKQLHLTVLTVDALEAALEDVYALWWARGMFCLDVEAHE